MELTIESQYRFGKLLYVLIQDEKKVEATRRVLAEQPHYDPNILFDSFADPSKSTMTSKTLRRFLTRNSLDLSKSQCKMLLSSFDRDRDGKVSFRDFFEVVNPCMETVKSKKSKRNTYEIEYTFTKLIEAELELQVHLEEQKKSLALRYDFNSISCFEMLDIDRKGHISASNILQFLSMLNYSLTLQDVKRLFARLGVYSGKLDIANFSKVLQEKKRELSIVDTFKEQIKIAKKYLECLEFDIEDSFNLVSQCTDRILPTDLRNTLLSLGVKFDESDFFLIYLHYDPEGKGFLSEEDYSNMFRCRMFEEKLCENDDGFYSYFRQAFEALINNERSFERARMKSQKLDLRLEFNLITSAKHFTFSDLRTILPIPDNDLQILFSIYDKKSTGKVKLSDFLLELSPRLRFPCEL